MRFTKLVFAAPLGALIIVSTLLAPARAQSPAPIFVPIALAPFQRDTVIELTALTLDAEIRESNGHAIMVGNSTFKLHNTDRLNDIQAPVGFPAWAGDLFAFDPARLDSFTVSIDGKKVATLNPARAEIKIGKEVRATDWYTFTLAIAGDEKRTVRYDFQQDLGDSAMPRFTYGLLPATGWKGSVGSARIEIQFPENTTLEQIVAYDPPNPHFDGSSLMWEFATNEPIANPSLTFLRPSLWSDLNAKRRATQQNPNDANTRAALGTLFSQLAHALRDTPRRDSFYAQAIAELETAVRLDANNRAARQSLGALYEARAGAAIGPRNAAYVQLAVAQWEPLAATDANARKQLAEDYFYLGLDAQTTGAYADALTYYDKARALAPNGAGPLFTIERANAQRRALNIAWARDLLERNSTTLAADKARTAFGNAFASTYTPPRFYVTDAQVTMESKTRTMVFSFASLQETATQTALNTTVTNLRAAGAQVELAADNSALTISIAFDTSADLLNKLVALADTLPDQPEWSRVRAILAPRSLTWNEDDEFLTESQRYHEQVDFSAACAKFVAQLDAINPSLAPLEKAAPNDDEAQLKRALLKNAQAGWRASLAQGRVTYRVGNEQVNVDACATREIVIESAPWRVDRIALIVGGVGIVGMAMLVWGWRARTRRRGDAAKR